MSFPRTRAFQVRHRPLLTVTAAHLQSDAGGWGLLMFWIRLWWVRPTYNITICTYSWNIHTIWKNTSISWCLPGFTRLGGRIHHWPPSCWLQKMDLHISSSFQKMGSSFQFSWIHIWRFPKMGPKSSILLGFSIINYPFRDTSMAITTISGWWFRTFCIFPSYWECHNLNWRSHIFQRGGSTTNQIIII